MSQQLLGEDNFCISSPLRPSAGRPHTSWLAIMKNDLSFHISVEDASELTLDRSL